MTRPQSLVRVRIAFPALILLSPPLAGCGSSDGDPAEASEEGPTMVSTGPVEPSEGAEQAGSTDPTVECQGFELDEGTWSIEPGGNIDYCVRIHTPEQWLGRDLALTGWSWDVPLAHHLFVEYSPTPFPGPGTDPVACDGVDPRRTFSILNSANNENSRLAFGAGQGTGHVMMEPGYGKVLPASGHFRTSHHVINTSTETVDVTANFKVCVQDATVTRHLINTLVCTTTAIDVPAGQRGAATATCTAPFDMEIVLLASHAHEHLERFTLRFFDGTTTHDEIIYENLDWDSPPIVPLDEPLRLDKGQGLTFSCEYEGPVWFEDGAESPEAEHCAAFTGYTYPAGERDYEQPPPLIGLTFEPDGVSEAILSPDGSPI